jgi:hypothetical protein
MKTKILKSNSNNSNYKNYWPKNPSFIFSEICYCGHKSNEHSLEGSKCSKQKICRCRGFLP